MHDCWRMSVAAIYLTLLSPPIASAGMPSASLTEVAQVRLSVISFFLLGLLLSAVAIQLLWNWLAKDFTWLPRLAYGRALALVSLWGLLFVVVLTMISGARELMTPGAWRKTGLTFEVADQKDPPSPDPKLALDQQLLKQRRQKLERLSAALHRYAGTHDGASPSSINDLATNDLATNEVWEVPGRSGTAYILQPNQSVSTDPKPLAYEPDVFDDDPLVLLTSGEIVQRPIDAIARSKEP
jgi:hypothetical protein